MRRRLSLTFLFALSLLCSNPHAAPAACTDPVHRQFDFWLGRWEVFAPNGTKAGDNVIASIADGCALAESWSGRGGVTGRSLNIFDKADRKWHQTWVDSSGSLLQLSGALAGNAMVLGATGPDPDTPGSTLTQRITWTPNADGSVRQHWEVSADGGKTWKTAFDGRYVRVP